MANVLGTNPMVIDSTGVITTERIFVKSIYIARNDPGGTVAASIYLLTESGGDEVLYHYDAEWQDTSLGILGWFPSLYVNAISNCKAYIFVGDGDY